MGACFCFSCSEQIDSQTRNRISLNGNWGLQLDTASVGITADWIGNRCSDSLFLPGTTDEGKKGEIQYRHDGNNGSFPRIYL